MNRKLILIIIFIFSFNFGFSTFTLNGDTITQTGTDNNLNGLNGLDGILITTLDNGKKFII